MHSPAAYIGSTTCQHLNIAMSKLTQPDGDKFITIQVSSKGKVAYRKLYQRTRDRVFARRHARVLANIDDPERARDLIKFFASSRTPEEERRRIAQVAQIGPLIPALGHEEARRELESIVCDFGDFAPGKIPEEIVEQWRATPVAEEQRAILLDLGVPEDSPRGNPLHVRRRPRAGDRKCLTWRKSGHRLACREGTISIPFCKHNGAPEMPAVTVRNWGDAMQARGRYTFLRSEAIGKTGLSAEAAKKALQRLARRKRVAKVKSYFYVIVPLEYRHAGGLPPPWFIDDLMKAMRGTKTGDKHDQAPRSHRHQQADPARTEQRPCLSGGFTLLRPPQSARAGSLHGSAGR